MRKLFILLFFASAISWSQDYPTIDVGQNKTVAVYTATLQFVEYLIKNDMPIGKNAIKIEFVDFTKVFDTPKAKNFIAYAAGAEDDSKIHILINPDKFFSLSNIGQLATLYHEVVHDLFDVAHVEDNIKHLMHPHSELETMNELTEAVYYFIQEYKAGKLNKL